jgi:hypothetical protein
MGCSNSALKVNVLGTTPLYPEICIFVGGAGVGVGVVSVGVGVVSVGVGCCFSWGWCCFSWGFSWGW